LTTAPLSLLDITKFYGASTGGVRTYLHAKAAWTSARTDVRHAVVVPGEADRVTDHGGVRWYAVRGMPIPGAAPYRLLAAPRAIAAILERERPDVIELGSHFLVPWQVFRANRRLGARVAWFAHADVPGLAARPWGWGTAAGAWRGAAARRYVAALGRRVDLVLAGSPGLAARLRESGASRVAVAPLGTDLRLYHPCRRERAADVRARLALPDGPFALYAGRLAREKELDVVLRAWPGVARRTGMHLVLAGSGGDLGRLRRLPGAADATWLQFEPEPRRMAELMAAAELYVAPGPHETFGLAAAEAAACGVPVLSVAEGAVGERVARSGTGAVYPRGDRAGLAEAAAAALEGGVGLRCRVREFAEAELGWDAAFAGLLREYRALARG
jgi:alpha-1,6-mannosyltransferase